MERCHAIFLDEKPILNYLRKYGRGSKSKDYEFVIAILVKRLFEKNTGLPYCISFELKNELLKYKPDFNTDDSNHIKDVLENNRIEKTLTDFALVKGTASLHEKNGWGFQLKRFQNKTTTNIIEEFIQYIDRISKDNSAGEVGLMVILDLFDNIDLQERKVFKKELESKKINKYFDIPSASFKKVFVFSGKSIETVALTEIWPSLRQVAM